MISVEFVFSFSSGFMFQALSEMKKLEISQVFEDSSDSDDCESGEIDHLFSNCELLHQTLVSETEYVLHVTATKYIYFLIKHVIWIVLEFKF